jgi:DUF1680 family protein
LVARGTRCTKLSPVCETLTDLPATALHSSSRSNFATWAETILSKLNPEQTQHMLNTEFGGMNEVLADLYADTGDKRWLDLSHRFDHDAFLDPLKRREDKLAGQHGNTQVPKMLGVLMQYIYTGETVVGNGGRVLLGRSRERSYLRDRRTRQRRILRTTRPIGRARRRQDDESCNVYNMLKMTRRLFAIHPDIKYADFEERALFNHVLAQSILKMAHLLHGADRSRRAARIPGHVS